MLAGCSLEISRMFEFMISDYRGCRTVEPATIFRFLDFLGVLVRVCLLYSNLFLCSESILLSVGEIFKGVLEVL